MRLQWAIFCHQTRVTPANQRDLLGVAGEIVSHDFRMPDKLRLHGAIGVSLVEGTPGVHRFWIVIQPPDGRPQDVRPVKEFEWPSESQVHCMDYRIDLIEEFVTGIWECRVLVDGEPIGVALLPVWYKVPKG